METRDSSPADLAYALRRALRRRAALGGRRVTHPGRVQEAPRPAADQDARQGQATDPSQVRTDAQAPPQVSPQAPSQNETDAAMQSRPQLGRPDTSKTSASQNETYTPPKSAPKIAATPSTPADSPAGHPAKLAAACASLEALRAAVADCRACALAKSRSQTVFGDGQGTSRILFVGEAPGADEDRTGTPFVGRAGQLLTDIITKGMGLARADVTVANVLKCRPPGNRDPLPEEKALCTGWLDRQIELVDPLVIVPLGRHAACHVLGVDAPLGRLRGKVHDRDGRKVVPTYHPAYLLRSPHDKRKTWEDIQLAMREAGVPVPGSR